MRWRVLARNEPRRSAPRPVFVDDSGRRLLRLRATAWSTGTVLVGFVGVIGLATVGSVGGPGGWALLATTPAPIGSAVTYGEGRPTTPGLTSATGSAEPSATADGPRGSVRAALPATATATPLKAQAAASTVPPAPAPVTTRAPAASPVPSPTTAPAATATAAASSHAANAPGQTRRPSTISKP